MRRLLVGGTFWMTSLVAAHSQTPNLLLFDADHKTFIGCLNCSNSDSGSVCNKYGDNGSKYANDSIWYQDGDFGSRRSNKSPWNKYSSEGPVIVDESGQFYGRFTANKNASDRTQIKALNQLADLVADGTELDDARNLFCGE